MSDHSSAAAEAGAGVGAQVPGTAPQVSVIVPHYQDLRSLGVCLDALERQTFPRDRFEIIVADNASPVGIEAVAAVVAGRAALRIVPEKGAGPARNGGVAHARGEILAFTDSDCIAEPGWLAAGVAALARCDVAGGQVNVLVTDPARVTPVEAFERIFAFNNQRYVEEERFTVTANMFCARSVFDKVGGFRVAISEDMDWSFRAGDAGYVLGFAADAVVGHPARRNWPELLQKWRRVNAEFLPLYRSRKNGMLIYLARTAVLPFSALAHTPKVLFSSELAGLSRRWAVLGVLYRLRFWRFFDSLRLLAQGGRGAKG